MLAGHSPANLVFFVPSLAMLLIPTGCSIVAFGVRGPIVVLRSFAALCRSEPTRAPDAKRIISACIGYVYGAGAFVFLASLLSIMASLREVVTSGLTQHFDEIVEITIVSLMYPVVLSELVLRPLKHRLAGRSGR